jgi:hypothetical protein
VRARASNEVFQRNRRIGCVWQRLRFARGSWSQGVQQSTCFSTSIPAQLVQPAIILSSSSLLPRGTTGLGAEMTYLSAEDDMHAQVGGRLSATTDMALCPVSKLHHSSR